MDMLIIVVCIAAIDVRNGNTTRGIEILRVGAKPYVGRFQSGFQGDLVAELLNEIGLCNEGIGMIGEISEAGPC